ncbi:hypothetical protein [Shewanella violacea]|uniref:Uncharacterized protein n=1 Tax=Shewanella violacea (strain JCM 10179 / CIP 106290 / LMG 19151 / DSS12) TaxID=637905 RepID=D4ZKH3_SHEVD|nr:hypothetical protein [Shewanella violacea]BAJ02172.1 conserved hypothetical protein [Shewanella violacea DSS12]
MPSVANIFLAPLLTLVVMIPYSSSAEPAIPIKLPSLQYQITIDPENPNQLNVSVDTQMLDNVSLLPARTAIHKNLPTLSCVKPDGSTTKIDYNERIQCNSLEWTLPLQVVSKDGFDPSTQLDTRDPIKDWYFVSETNSLVRFNDLSRNEEILGSMVCTPNKVCSELPSTSLPPLFLLWGMDTTTLNISDKIVTVHSDTPLVIKHLQSWKPTLEKQLNYLNHVFPNDVKQWQMAFFSRDKAVRGVGGAAGSNLILINALLDHNKLTHDSIQMMLRIASHESIHVMNTQDTPSWAGESLAEYYALKSMRGSKFEMQDPTERWHEFAIKFPFANTGLFEAHRHVKEQHEYQYYPLFYFEGAAFWNDLDNALTDTGSNLDEWITRLSFSDYHFSNTFIASITKQIGQEKWLEISNSYL